MDPMEPTPLRPSPGPPGRLVVEGVVATYLVGWVVGRGIGVLWVHGPVTEEGLRRLRGGAAGILHRHAA